MEVPREQLMRLLELAEDSILTGCSEFGDNPTDEDRELMLSLWRRAEKEVPEYFRRTFGWKIDSEVEPDGREN